MRTKRVVEATYGIPVAGEIIHRTTEWGSECDS